MKDVCADCGKLDPTWTSLNRGILLCQECCSVHRSIGRHVSWVRSLHQGWWSPTLLMMVESLNKAGANSIWEHSRLDQTASPTSCKPTPVDPVPTNKEEFIRSKHEELSFVLKVDQDVDGPEGLGAQLHAAARTPDLLTSLRLLSQGADPNFYHEEKGSTALHVAAKSGQALQVELLVIHGAELVRRDRAGRTPEEAARDAGHVTIAERLRTCRYHAVDRLVQYLCSRKPGQNGNPITYLTGLDNIRGVDNGDFSKEGRLRLQALSNSQFEKLVADVYDEVDRREAGAAWLGATTTDSAKSDPAPFLPVHPELSATRNQGRQKLGRLSSRDFDILIHDVLSDARRRDVSLVPGKPVAVSSIGPKLRTDISDDEPLYDSVASDEDYATVKTPSDTKENQQLLTALHVNQTKMSSEPTNQPQTAILSGSHDDARSSNRATDNNDVRRSLATSAATIAKLQTEIQMLQDKVVGLMRENRDLRDEMSRSRSFGRVSELIVDDDTSTRARGCRPTSMYETRERLRNSPVKVSQRQDETLNQHQKVNIWPEYNEVTKRTAHVTKRIQELCTAMSDFDFRNFAPCSLNIRYAVADLSSLFPQALADPLLSNLALAVSRLEFECSAAQHCPPSAQTQCIQSIRHAAYEIAKATKQLVLKCGELTQSYLKTPSTD